MRKAKVYYKDKLTGILTETDEGKYKFDYDEEYLENPNAKPISLTMPTQYPSYSSDVLFSFFEGLIAEGWLLDIAKGIWKINREDRMGLLLVCCSNCIGAVSVLPHPDNKI